ncbi:hypothetical protein GCM10023212_26850 [Luteolibacter yonseiensis]
MAGMLAATGFVHGREVPESIVGKLGSQRFREREDAEEELLAWTRSQPGDGADILLKASHVQKDPEVRERCLSVLRVVVADQYSKEGRGYIGIGLKAFVGNLPGEAEPCGMIQVTQVQPDFPGQRAGLRPADLIVSLDGETWRDATAHEEFSRKIAGLKPDTKVRLKVLRDQKLLDLEATLVRRPVVADNPFFDSRKTDAEGLEQAAREAHFKQWMNERRIDD